jgi:hypothetical protein
VSDNAMSTNVRERIKALIELLEAVRPVPHTYMIRHDTELAEAFLSGLRRTAERLLGVSSSGELRCRVWEERGWQRGARGPVLSMQREGLTHEAIVDELIAIEIEVWKRVVAGHSGD